MLNKIRNKIVSTIFIKAFEKVEKSDWMTQVLKVCFKNRIIRAVWGNFLNSVKSVLEDAKEEIEQARVWSEYP